MKFFKIDTHSLTHRCVSPHSCTSNAACKEGELCKHYSVLLLLLKYFNTGSSDTCQPKVVGAGSEEWDECGTNVDCENKNVGKPVCKETMRGRLCVTERECISIFSTLFFFNIFNIQGVHLNLRNSRDLRLEAPMSISHKLQLEQ